MFDAFEASDEGVVYLLGLLGLLLLQVVDAVEDVLESDSDGAFLEGEGEDAFLFVGRVDHCCCNIIINGA